MSILGPLLQESMTCKRVNMKTSQFHHLICNLTFFQVTDGFSLVTTLEEKWDLPPFSSRFQRSGTLSEIEVPTTWIHALPIQEMWSPVKQKVLGSILFVIWFRFRIWIPSIYLLKKRKLLPATSDLLIPAVKTYWLQWISSFDIYPYYFLARIKSAVIKKKASQSTLLATPHAF